MGVVIVDCQHIRDQIETIALIPPSDSVDPDVAEHLRECESCRVELRKCQEAWLALPASLPTTELANDVEANVMQRIAGSPSAKPAYSHQATFWRYALAAGVLFFLSSVTLLKLDYFEGSKPSEDAMQDIRAIADQMQKLGDLEKAFANPQLRYVSLTSKERNSARGYLVLDPVAKQFHFYGRKLRVTPPAKLVAWLADDQDAVLAYSVIDVNADHAVGTALLKMDDPSRVGAVIITREKLPIPTEPSDDVLLRSSYLGPPTAD